MKKLEVIQDNGEGQVTITIPNVISFKEIKECTHFYVQAMYTFDTHKELGKAVCLNCGEIKS